MSQRPDSVPQRPDSVSHRPESVPQRPEFSGFQQDIQDIQAVYHPLYAGDYTLGDKALKALSFGLRPMFERQKGRAHPGLCIIPLLVLSSRQQYGMGNRASNHKNNNIIILIIIDGLEPV